MLETEALGSKEKFWYRREQEESPWLFKFPQPNTGQHWAEKIAAEIAGILDIEHARVELAVFEGTKGSASESFVPRGIDLYHGNQILAGKVLEYDPSRKFLQSDHTLANIFLALARTFITVEGLRESQESFAGYLVLDALIGNTDRHHENWGILVKETGSKSLGSLAPTFDHASSLGRELLDEGPGKTRQRLLEKDGIRKRVGAACGQATHTTIRVCHGKIGSVRALDNRDNREPGSRGLDDASRAQICCRTDVLQSPGIEIDCAMNNKTLFLAWQDKAKTRRWFPVGRLDVRHPETLYRFRYVKGAKEAQDELGFEPLVDFPEFYRNYESSELFPLFQNRVLMPGRRDFHEYLKLLDLPDQADPIEILSVGGGYRATDSFEVFPKIVRRSDGSFRCRFFLHGWRRVNADSLQRLEQIKAAEKLYAAIELTNPAMHLAVQIQTRDYYVVGWAPRYLVGDLVQAIAKAPGDYEAFVVRVNPVPAPSQHRVLVELRGHWPDYEPMTREEFEPLVQVPEFVSTQ